MFAKIFTQIFDSSIADNWQHRHVFEDLLKLADRYGVVDMTPEAICARTRLPKKMVDDALTALAMPDPRSRSKEEEGRRIVPLDPERSWGWRIVNHSKYREIKTEFDRTAYMRDYMRDKRAEKKAVKPEFNKSLTSVSVSVQGEGTSKCTSTESGSDQALLQACFKHLNEMFRRSPNQHWTYAEQSALAAIVRRPECEQELKEIAALREREPQYFPRSLERLLTNWSSILDRSRVPAAKPAKGDHRAERRSREYQQTIKAKRL